MYQSDGGTASEIIGFIAIYKGRLPRSSLGASALETDGGHIAAFQIRRLLVIAKPLIVLKTLPSAITEEAAAEEFNLSIE